MGRNAGLMRTLTGVDAHAFLAEKGTKRVGVHTMGGRIAHWAFCRRCGLVALRNPATRRALRAPCVVYE